MANVLSSQPYRRARSSSGLGLTLSIQLAAVIFASAVTLGEARADVTLGVLIPSSGKGAAYGTQQQNAIDMFMEKYSDLGAAGKLKLDIYDTRGENPEAINLTRKLIGSDVVAIVGPQFSAEAEVAFPLAVRGETPIMTPMAAKPGIASANQPWAFRYALTSENVYGPLVDAWVKRQAKPIKTVVDPDGRQGCGERQRRQERISGGAQGARPANPGHDHVPDRRYRLLGAGDARQERSILTGSSSRRSTTRPATWPSELRKQGMNQPIVAGVGINHPSFIELGGPAAEGAMAGFDFFVDDPKPAVASWAAEFEKRFKAQPSNAAAEIYDTLYLMRDCIISTGITGKDVAADRSQDARLLGQHEESRIAPLMGATSIEKGDAVRSPVVLEVKGGRFSVAK